MIDKNKIERLTNLISEIGLSQVDFALKLNVKQQSISEMVRGKRAIGKNFIRNLKLTFGVNPEWMETGEGEMYIEKKEVQEDSMITLPRSCFETINKQNDTINSQQRMIEKQTDTINSQLEIIKILASELKKTSSAIVPREDAGCAAAG